MRAIATSFSRMLWPALLVATAALGHASTAQAQPRGRAAITDGRVSALFAERDRSGKTLPFFKASPKFEATGKAPLLVYTHKPLSSMQMRRLAKADVQVGKRLASGAYEVEADVSGLAKLEALPEVHLIRVNLPPPLVVRPLDKAAEEMGVIGGGAAYRAMLGKGLTGAGVVVGDMDSGIDPYHPAFFKKGTYHRWVDVDKDGALTPGVDGVDMDGDGTIGDTEVLRLLNGYARQLHGGNSPIVGTGDKNYNPDVDYLYLDLDANGKRDIGANFSKMPGFGEPIFIADDVDKSGKVGLSEKLVQLGESKIRALRQAGTEYKRGENLGLYRPNRLGPDTASHGTGVMATVAGGQQGLSRFQGVAPGAEILLINNSGGSLTSSMQWLHDQGADIVLTELGVWGYEVGDGSSDLELLIDSLATQGQLTVSPAGNLGYSRKHAFANIPGSDAANPYTNGLDWGGGGQNPGRIWISFTWRQGDVKLTGSLSTADGDVIDLSQPGSSTTTAGRTVQIATGMTPKGAGYMLIYIDTNGTPLPHSNNPIELKTDQAGKAADATFYVIDDVSGWAGATEFLNGDKAGCMNPPAFAARTLAVSAYALNTGPDFGGGESFGALREYSGRGPDLWGDPGIDIAAPDNAVAATSQPFVGNANILAIDEVPWAEFGGTSGAGPEVAAIAALLKEANPQLSGETLRQAVLDATTQDAQVMSGDETLWGKGKVRLGKAAPSGTPLTLSLTGPEKAAPGASVALKAEVQDDGDAAQLKVRWDGDYDGSWDEAASAATTKEFTMPSDGKDLLVKVEVVDADGWSKLATARVISDEGEGGSAGGAGSAGSAGSGGDAGSAGDSASAGTSAGAAGASGAAAAPSNNADPAPAAEGGGCGCQLDGQPTGTAAGWLGGLALFAMAALRRPKRGNKGR